MTKSLLNITDLYASAENKTILQNLNLNINKGETHILMGPNGAGKSTLGNVIMGNSQYKVDRGSIFLKMKISLLLELMNVLKRIILIFPKPYRNPWCFYLSIYPYCYGNKRKNPPKSFS